MPQRFLIYQTHKRPTTKRNFFDTILQNSRLKRSKPNSLIFSWVCQRWPGLFTISAVAYAAQNSLQFLDRETFPREENVANISRLSGMNLDIYSIISFISTIHLGVSIITHIYKSDIVWITHFCIALYVYY